MKFLLITLISVFSLVNVKAHASDDVNVSAAVLASFHSAFKNASDVKWKTSGDYFKADFIVNEQYVTAFYDCNADLVAVTRNINSFQLPVTLQTKLKASYEKYWISDLFELSNENGVSYYATVENGEQKITLKSSNAIDWVLYQKQSKS